MAMPDSQWYPLILNMITNVEENGVFLTRKVFNSDNSPLLFISKKINQVTFEDKTQMIRNSLKKQKHGYLIHNLSDKALKSLLQYL